MTFDLDIWHASSPWHYRDQVRRWMSWVKVRGYRTKSVAKVVGATSSEGFFWLSIRLLYRIHFLRLPPSTVQAF